MRLQPTIAGLAAIQRACQHVEKTAVAGPARYGSALNGSA